MDKTKLSQEEVNKHIDLYMHVKSVVGHEYLLSFIINALMNCLFHIKDKKSNEFLTKKEIKQLLYKILDNITKRIDESVERK